MSEAPLSSHTFPEPGAGQAAHVLGRSAESRTRTNEFQPSRQADYGGGKGQWVGVPGFHRPQLSGQGMASPLLF